MTQKASKPPPDGQKVRVWDLPVRVFHWVLVAAVGIALITGFAAPEWWLGVHAGAGYTIVALIVFRIVWGVFGGGHSRIASFARAPIYLRHYVRGLMLLSPPPYVGHNPIGVLMIAALFLALAGLTTTGLMALGGTEKQGLFAGLIWYEQGRAALAVHTILAFVLLAMIALHVGGVIGESALTRENLALAMITGRKRRPPDVAVKTPKPARPILAALTLFGIGAVFAPFLYLAERMPPLGVPTLAPNANYAEACGRCHQAYHPSLLPAASWQALTASRHFGWRAGRDEADVAAIRAWLSANAAEVWDTEASHGFRVVAPDAPWRITATPYWQRRHATLAPELFAGPEIRSAGNCLACHRDAASGRFIDQAIQMPGHR